MASMGLELDSKIGATFLGNIFAAIFYGITSIQTFIYFDRQRGEGDGVKYKMLVSFLWILDTLHLIFVCHASYYYLITNYFNPVALTAANWSIITQIIITCISNVIIRGLYAHRVWSFARRKPMLAIPLVGLIVLTIIASFGSGLGFSIRVFQAPQFSGFDKFSYLMYTALGTGVGVDAMIALVLCVSLSTSRTGFKRTDSLVNILMAYTINTSLLTSLCSIATFTTYTIWPHEMTYIGIYFTLSKLYLNSLLATLNGRSAIRERVNNSYGLSNMSGGRGQNSSSGGNVVSNSHVVLNVNKEVETVIRVEQDQLKRDYVTDVKHDFGAI
ncbi:hypothetical protein BD626DRAFT_562837 [Schizophyllum amplum]|uniref:DUF6534 domain-containing protein n=1 Tax=Schizophyllum amplum TaxID=97359 RepID=A0A550CW63_9AGAR|nr:hypothetical protein BD626DRAFT_562837 [Auriculariopsis ampla]